MGLMKELADLNAIYQKMNVTEVSADTALRASKKADVERGKAAVAGDTEKAKAKAAQASRLYKASAEKRKSEPVKQPDRSYPKGKGASYKESYETQKKKEVLSAMKRQGRKLSDKDKEKIANKVVASKGDTSKSDDRYAYEEFQPSETVMKLVESGKFSVEELWKIVEVEEGYQRDPEGGEEKERQRRRSQKGGDRTEKVRGERTPMPPRGDKRREDFERWYAANVR